MNAPYAPPPQFFGTQAEALVALEQIVTEAEKLKNIGSEFVIADIEAQEADMKHRFSINNGYQAFNYMILRSLFIEYDRRNGRGVRPQNMRDVRRNGKVLAPNITPVHSDGGRRRKLSRRVTYRRKSKKRSHRRSRK